MHIENEKKPAEAGFFNDIELSLVKHIVKQ